MNSRASINRTSNNTSPSDGRRDADTEPGPQAGAAPTQQGASHSAVDGLRRSLGGSVQTHVARSLARIAALDQDGPALRSMIAISPTAKDRARRLDLDLER